VQDFVRTARLLHNLTWKNATSDWSKDCKEAFLELKNRLTSASILLSQCSEGQYILNTDASDTALGAILQQQQDGQLRVIGYASRALSNAERHYCIMHKELLGVVYGLKKYRQHLLGWPIVVRTDHTAFTFVIKMPEPVGQQGR